MSTPAIRTEGLSKRYGSVDALLGLDLEIAEYDLLIQRFDLDPSNGTGIPALRARGA
jgi:hypothetical protein